MMLGRARRRAGASRELGAVVLEAAPLTVGATRKRALRCGHPAQGGVHDGQTAARDDRSRDFAIAEHLVVIVALFVAVKQTAHRGVSPIDNADPPLAVEVRAAADEYVASLAVFFQGEVAEVGRLGVYLNFDGFALARGKD